MEKDYVDCLAQEKELGVQAPVGFWDPAGLIIRCQLCLVSHASYQSRLLAGFTSDGDAIVLWHALALDVEAVEGVDIPPPLPPIASVDFPMLPSSLQHYITRCTESTESVQV